MHSFNPELFVLLLIMLSFRAYSYRLNPFHLSKVRSFVSASTKCYFHVADQSSADNVSSLKIDNIVGEEDMEKLGSLFAKVLLPGNVVLLKGVEYYPT